MSRLNDLQFRYGSHGLQVLSVNYANTIVEIDGFCAGYGVRCGVAKVADASGYTVPIFSTVFAINREGKVLWIGLNTSITDAMVEEWLAEPVGDASKQSDEGQGCTTRENYAGQFFVLAACFLAIWSRRPRSTRA